MKAGVIEDGFPSASPDRAEISSLAHSLRDRLRDVEGEAVVRLVASVLNAHRPLDAVTISELSHVERKNWARRACTVPGMYLKWLLLAAGKTDSAHVRCFGWICGQSLGSGRGHFCGRIV